MKPTEPLWRVMNDAFMDAEGSLGVAVAAEIRAIADALQSRFVFCFVESEVEEAVAWLRAEADRAEAGE